MNIGLDRDGDVNVPFCNLLPMVSPNDIVLDGKCNLLPMVSPNDIVFDGK